MKNEDFPPDESLYHYTSIQGLIGIIKDKKFWTTSIYHLNDKQELFHARDIFKSAIDNVKPDRVRPAVNNLGSTSVDEYYYLDSIVELLNMTSAIPIFVGSFSEVRDQLSQWRGYSPNGNGFILGFNYSKLKAIIEKRGFHLSKCIYEEAIQKKIVDEFIENNIKAKHSEFKKNGANLRNILREVLKILPIFKNNSFKDEKEWRMIGYSKQLLNDIQLRVGKTVAIPYFELELFIDDKNEFPIDSITIGPTPYMEESYKSIIMLVKKEKIEDKVKVYKTEIPYREI